MSQPEKINKEPLTAETASAIYNEIELTEDEKALALLEARQRKYAREYQKNYLEKLRDVPVYPKYTAEQLFEMVGADYTVDDFNKEIVWRLCLYFSRDQRSPDNFKKGILLFGGVGCGKTTLMEFFRFNQTNSYAMIPVRDVAQDYQKGGSEAILRHKALYPSSDPSKSFGQAFVGVCFDDLGLEVDKKHYGNESNVMAEILLTRYDRFRVLDDRDKTRWGKTHITTNLNTTQLEERYGVRVRSRLREMCNVLVFGDNAPDRRK